MSQLHANTSLTTLSPIQCGAVQLKPFPQLLAIVQQNREKLPINDWTEEITPLPVGRIENVQVQVVLTGLFIFGLGCALKVERGRLGWLLRGQRRTNHERNDERCGIITVHDGPVSFSRADA